MATRPQILFYAMYEPGGLDSAPKVRITLLGAALERVVDVTWIRGGRLARLRPALGWILRRGWRGVDAVYVEAASSTSMPWDLLLLACARLAGRPVGVYFRDGYWLFRDIYPTSGLGPRVLDAAMRLTHPLMTRLATRRFAPSDGLARILGLRDAILLPPGTDPSLPDLGVGDAAIVAAVISPTTAGGLGLLWEAMERVRSVRPGTRLRVVSGPLPAGPWRDASWLESVSAHRAGLAAALGPARLCVIPLPLTRYTELAVPVRVADLLSLGKPIVATATHEMARWLGPTDAALLAPGEPDALAEAIVRVLDDHGLATRIARNARILAEHPSSTWDARAQTVLEQLAPGAAGR